MSTPEPASPPSAAPPGAPLEDVRTLYRAAVDCQTGGDRGQEVALLKAFLAGVEGRANELVPSGEEVGPLLDDTAMQFNQLGQPVLALRAIDRALSFQPGSVPLLHHKALILLGQNKDLPEVLALVGHALQAAPNDRALWATRGDALKLLKRPGEAAEAYLRAQQLDATSTQYVRQGAAPRSHRPQGAANEARPRRSPRRRPQWARGRRRTPQGLARRPGPPARSRAPPRLRGPTDRSARRRHPLRGERPENDPANLLAIRLQFEGGPSEEGSVSARQLIGRTEAPDATTLGELSRLLEKPAPELALSARQRLAQVDAHNLQNLQALRSLAMRLDRVDAALAACQAILVSQPDNLDALAGVAELQVSEGHTDAALDSYRAIVKAQPQALVEHRKGLEFARSVHNDAAVREFAQAILAEDPSDVSAQLELARSYAAGGDTANALTAYDSLLTAHPGQLPYLLEKRNLLASSSDPAQLAPVLDELFRLDPTRTDLAIERGNLYLSLAYDFPEGSAERDQSARTALVSYERASTDAEAASVAELGIARASRLVADSDRAIRGYQAFLARDENATRNDVRKELGHALRETGRYAEAIEVYSALSRPASTTPTCSGARSRCWTT